MRGPRGPEESLGVMPTSADGLAHHGSHEGEEKGPGGHGSSLCWILRGHLLCFFLPDSLPTLFLSVSACVGPARAGEQC